MCANYIPVTRADRLLSHFGVTRARDEDLVDIWPGGLAPFIRLAEAGSGNRRVVDDGLFGLAPAVQAEIAPGKRLHNARSETVASKRSFREAWAQGQRCIVPAEAIYEPFYASADAKSERWRIQLPGGEPMGIAGIYRVERDAYHRDVMTFAMLTVNADDHPVLSRFHAHGEEKRMVVILKPQDYGAWLTCSVDEAARFFTTWDGPLETAAAPLARRAPRAISGRVVRPKPEEGDLFGGLGDSP